LQASQAFEWIGGRFSTTDLQQLDWTDLEHQIQNHSHGDTTLRLLTTRAEAGPAGSSTSSQQQRCRAGDTPSKGAVSGWPHKHKPITSSKRKDGVDHKTVGWKP
jgi:hypothetical protein